jgi:hypothetical protein
MSAAPAFAIADPFSVHMEAVARKCLGEPNARLSSKSELRFGTQGSMSVDLEKGVWADHEAATGGGVMDLLAREKGLKGQDAIAWLRRECGADFEDRAQEPAPKARIVATYDYVDEHGELLYQVCRLDPKTFRQRRPEGQGWSWSVKGVRQIPYRLPQVLAAIAKGETIYIVEGEKDADNLAREGACATCNPMGAGKWSDGLSEPFRGADVVILPDNDDAGHHHALNVAANLKPVARSVRVLDLPDLPPKGDVSDWLNAGGDECELTILAAKTRPWAPEAPASRFGAIRWADMDSVAVNYVPLVKGLIFQGDTGMFYGDSGSGKSFLAVDMGLSIARGVPFLGMKTAKGGVLYQAGEGGKGLLKRMKAYRLEHRVTGDLPFVLLPEKVNLFAADGDVDPFIGECLAWKAALSEPLSLIVIDTFSAASTGANENASEDMGRMLDAGYRLNKATGAAVVWVHHKNAGGLRERGHTSFRANIETVVEVIKDPETKERTLHLVKLKDGEDGLRLGFELQSVTLGSDDDGDPITSCVVRPAQLGTVQTSKRGRLSKGQHDFLKVLDTAVSQWGGVVPGVGSYGVLTDEFKDLFVNTCGFGRTDEAIRQAMSRDGKDLLVSGMIGRKDAYVWITEKGGLFL